MLKPKTILNQIQDIINKIYHSLNNTHMHIYYIDNSNSNK